MIASEMSSHSRTTNNSVSEIQTPQSTKIKKQFKDRFVSIYFSRILFSFIICAEKYLTLVSCGNECHMHYNATASLPPAQKDINCKVKVHGFSKIGT